jgi:hypothetical protein
MGVHAPHALPYPRRPQPRHVHHRHRFETTVDLDAHHAETTLDDLDLSDDN